jgi:hypothetical protein
MPSGQPQGIGCGSNTFGLNRSKVTFPCPTSRFFDKIEEMAVDCFERSSRLHRPWGGGITLKEEERDLSPRGGRSSVVEKDSALTLEKGEGEALVQSRSEQASTLSLEQW